jgi:hypothetical protein
VGSGVSVKGFSPNFDEFVRTNFYHRAHRGHRDKLKKLSEVFGPEKKFSEGNPFFVLFFLEPSKRALGKESEGSADGQGEFGKKFR